VTSMPSVAANGTLASNADPRASVSTSVMAAILPISNFAG
jgi:hypothetical protein